MRPSFPKKIAQASSYTEATITFLILVKSNYFFGKKHPFFMGNTNLERNKNRSQRNSHACVPLTVSFNLRQFFKVLLNDAQ
jgi:hypothetical protein